MFLDTFNERSLILAAMQLFLEVCVCVWVGVCVWVCGGGGGIKRDRLVQQTVSLH